MFVYLTDKKGQLVEVMRFGNPRFEIWNDILERDLTEVHKLPLQLLAKVETANLFEKVEDKLKLLIDENNQATNDHPSWQGRFKEEDVFVKMTLFGKNYTLCTSGRENYIIFLGNISNYITNKDFGSKKSFCGVKVVFLPRTFRC